MLGEGAMTAEMMALRHGLEPAGGANPAYSGWRSSVGSHDGQGFVLSRA